MGEEEEGEQHIVFICTLGMSFIKPNKSWPTVRMTYLSAPGSRRNMAEPVGGQLPLDLGGILY